MDIQRRTTNNAHHFELRLDDEVVSSLVLFDYQLTYKAALLRMGGIAGVGTNEKHRKKGYASRVVKAAVQWMQEEGYHCSFLFGIPDFYWRFGYTTVLSDAKTRVLVRNAERVVAPAHTVRPMEPADRLAVSELYNHNMTKRRGGLLRTASWKGFTKGSQWTVKPECIVVQSSDGEFLGYAVCDADRPEVTISEVETKEPSAQHSILRFLVDRGIQNREKEITYLGPSNHPFAVYCRTYGAEHTEGIAYGADGMARLFGLSTCLRTIAPELSNRSRLLPDTTDLVICVHTDIGHCYLHVCRGHVTVTAGKPRSHVDYAIACKQTDLARLVFGATDALSFLLATSTDVHDELASTIAVLFPTELITFHPTERF